MNKQHCEKCGDLLKHEKNGPLYYFDYTLETIVFRTSHSHYYCPSCWHKLEHLLQDNGFIVTEVLN